MYAARTRRRGVDLADADNARLLDAVGRGSDVGTRGRPRARRRGVRPRRRRRPHGPDAGRRGGAAAAAAGRRRWRWLDRGAARALSGRSPAGRAERARCQCPRRPAGGPRRPGRERPRPGRSVGARSRYGPAERAKPTGRQAPSLPLKPLRRRCLGSGRDLDAAGRRGPHALRARRRGGGAVGPAGHLWRLDRGRPDQRRLGLLLWCGLPFGRRRV